METTLLIAILTLGLLPGLTPEAEARHPASQTQIFISGYQRCGTPIYKVRYLAGYDRCGNPVWRVRQPCRSELVRIRSNCNRSNYRGYAGYGQSRITYTNSSGRGYSHRYYSSSPSRCRSW